MVARVDNSKYSVDDAIRYIYMKNPDIMLKAELGVKVGFFRKILLKIAFMGLKEDKNEH